MTLPQFYAEVFSPMRLVGLSPRTVIGYVTAITNWSRFSTATLNQIDALLIATWQANLLKHHAVATVNTYVRTLMVVLRCAVEQGLLASVPGVRKLREPQRVPLALTVDEFAKVLRAAERERHPELWRAALLTDWETGLRLAALLSIRPVDVLWESSGLFCQPDEQKTKTAQWFQLQPETLDAIRVIYSMENERLFNFCRTIRTLGRNLRRIFDTCGIFAPVGASMVWHRLRKSKASYTQLAGGNATAALSHSSPKITERYLDPRIVGRASQPPMPIPN